MQCPSLQINKRYVNQCSATPRFKQSLCIMITKKLIHRCCLLLTHTYQSVIRITQSRNHRHKWQSQHMQRASTFLKSINKGNCNAKTKWRSQHVFVYSSLYTVSRGRSVLSHTHWLISHMMRAKEHRKHRKHFSPLTKCDVQSQWVRVCLPAAWVRVQLVLSPAA